MPSIRGPACLNALTRSYLPFRVLICPQSRGQSSYLPFRVLICPLHLITAILHFSLLSIFKTSKIPFGVSEYPFNVYNVSFVLMLFIFDERNDFLNISC